MAYCGNCGQDTLEGKPDKDGIWHYRCQYCVDHADPNASNPCPKCGCTAHENICGIWNDNEEGHEKCKEDITNTLRPDITMFQCLNCGYKWETPEYEQYLFNRNIKSIMKEVNPNELQ
jgi:ribosomal protein L37AE/L43A